MIACGVLNEIGSNNFRKTILVVMKPMTFTTIYSTVVHQPEFFLNLFITYIYIYVAMNDVTNRM